MVPDGPRGQFNTLRPRQNVRRFADDTFKRIFLNENVRISNKISLKFVPKGLITNNPALVQIMAWRRSGDKPLSEPMLVSLLTHIYASLGLNELKKFPSLAVLEAVILTKFRETTEDISDSVNRAIHHPGGIQIVRRVKINRPVSDHN